MQDQDIDRPPSRTMVEPSPDDIRRAPPPQGVNPDELDGPDDLIINEEEIKRARIPAITWASDAEAPDYAHLAMEGREPTVGDKEFEFGADELELLLRTNGFEPAGYEDRFVFALRGASLVGKDTAEGVDRIKLEETRPDHKNFRCTIGFFSRKTRKLSAFKASTVPNTKYMTNYYQYKNDLGGTATGANMLPTGCYIFRVGSHSGGKIYPALRMTNPDNLTEDATVTTLRTFNDLTFKHDDFFEKCMPFDNVHCAYEYDAFSSAGCLTICGPNGQGPWGRFQSVLRTMKTNTRQDVVLLTGREASMAAYLKQAGRDTDQELVDRLLRRLRSGAYGEAVKRLQAKLNTSVTGYFGPATKLALVNHQRSAKVPSDGVFSPKLDQAFGWDVFKAAAAPAGQPSPQYLPGEPIAEPAPVPGPAPKPAPAVGPVVSDQTVVPAPAPVPRPEPVARPEIPAPAAPAADVAAAGAPAAPVEPAKPAPAPVAEQPTGPITSPQIVPPRPAAMVTGDTLKRFASRALPQYVETFSKGGELLDKYGISQAPIRLCHFLGQIGNECGRLTILEENMNYTTAARIQAVWPSRFTLASAQAYVRNPEKLANKVYGDRLGNNQPGDGWRYRGRGLVQITGRGSYREMGKRLGIPLEENPDLAFHPDHALKIACETWKMKQLAGERDMNQLAEVNKLDAMTYRINGGYTNIDDRRSAFEEAWKIWSSGAAPPKALDSATYDRGDRGDRVSVLNKNLNKLNLFKGITSSPPQQTYSYSTYEAVRKLQGQEKLGQTGFVDPATWETLDKLLDSRSAPTRGPVTRSPDAPEEADRPDAGQWARVREYAWLIRNWAWILGVGAAAFIAYYSFQMFGAAPVRPFTIILPIFGAVAVLLSAFGIGGLSRTLMRNARSATESAEPTRSGPTRGVAPGASAIPEEEPIRMDVNLDGAAH